MITAIYVIAVYWLTWMVDWLIDIIDHLYVSVETKPGRVYIKEDVYDICYEG